MLRSLVLIPLLSGFLALPSVGQDNTKLYLRGGGWYQFGQVVHSTDTLDPALDYNGNWYQNSGAQFTVVADIGDNLQGAMGLGGLQFHNTQGRAKENLKVYPGFTPYITEARVSYFAGSREESPFLFHIGYFPYQYNRDVRNLGAYLFRGPVYPSILISEFESKTLDTTVANILGFQIRNNIGSVFTHDLIVRSEIDFTPVYDISVGYVAALKLGGVLELGGGVNFYRLLNVNSDLSELTKDKLEFPIQRPDSTGHPYEGNYAVFGPAGDTIFLSHQGIKVMGRISIDPKPLFGNPEILGPKDLKLYAEAAVIGTKDYPVVYDNIMERIPIMFGFYIPTFRLLDELVFEFEWFGAPWRDDYFRVYKDASPMPTNNTVYNRKPDTAGFVDGQAPARFEDFDVTKMTKDDIKWSLFASRSFANCLKLSFQVANDHFRPNTIQNFDLYSASRFESAFTTLDDWYVMFRLGFFF